MHTLVLTKVQQAVAELTDEEFEEFSSIADDEEQFEYLDAWYSDMDTVERTIEEV